MAHIATIQVLVRDEDEARVRAGLLDMMRIAQEPVDRYATGPQEPLWLADFRVATVDKANPLLTAALEADNYNERLLDGELIIFSASEAMQSEERAGFWSHTFGWTTLETATRFGADSGAVSLPASIGMDAAWMLVPHGQHFFIVELELDGVLKRCEPFWSGTLDEARAAAVAQYAGWRVLSVQQIARRV